MLADAVSSGSAIAPTGSGTKKRFGNSLSREAIALSTRRLDRVLVYEPDDMTISVEAGVPIGTVWRTLAERGQTIPIDVPLPESETIGGLIATGLCGPRRFGSGSLRDLLIGIEAAYPDGTVGKAGGLVVKNVSGFDLMRMHLGAVGTLGVVTSANFKVVPAARGEATITVERETLDQVEADRIAVHRGRIRPIAYEARLAGDRWHESIRIEGRPSTVDQMARELADNLGDASTMQTDESRSFWSAYTREEATEPQEERLILRVRGKPAATQATAERAIKTMTASGATIDDCRLSPGLGTVRLVVSYPAESVEPLGQAIDHLRSAGSNVLILNAPSTLQGRVDAFGNPESTLELMRQLKRQFDPWSVLNPGRVIPEL